MTISDDTFRIWGQVPHGRKSALVENLLTQWAKQYERDPYSGSVKVEANPVPTIEELEERVRRLK